MTKILFILLFTLFSGICYADTFLTCQVYVKYKVQKTINVIISAEQMEFDNQKLNKYTDRDDKRFIAAQSPDTKISANFDTETMIIYALVGRHSVFGKCIEDKPPIGN